MTTKVRARRSGSSCDSGCACQAQLRNRLDNPLTVTRRLAGEAAQFSSLHAASGHLAWNVLQCAVPPATGDIASCFSSKQLHSIEGAVGVFDFVS
ncbi:hypothetical protein WJX74_003398 [Apatococcus lobatus]|uniref:Uncharacterized protein n=1 Tax=Apatococcus lobatus TaxID=904363 RepID=A0AAW1Q558_9CHLO